MKTPRSVLTREILRDLFLVGVLAICIYFTGPLTIANLAGFAVGWIGVELIRLAVGS